MELLYQYNRDHGPPGVDTSIRVLSWVASDMSGATLLMENGMISTADLFTVIFRESKRSQRKQRIGHITMDDDYVSDASSKRGFLPSRE
jgi:hypothetical protein